ncbi:hypothetical protein [Bacillus cereus]|uniref:hypothetical protein n=1 Tax=Bacillus cereus TaxID=1396 RepID=UPI00387A5056
MYLAKGHTYAYICHWCVLFFVFYKFLKKEREWKLFIELKDKGYDWKDINDWILSIETEYSKHGNKLVIY